MHPQITDAVSKASLYNLRLSDVAQKNAEKLLNYIEDINLEKNVRFRPTSSGGLFVSWVIGNWEYQMECAKNGYIIYAFTESDYQKATGCLLFDDFIPQFEKYLLML